MGHRADLTALYVNTSHNIWGQKPLPSAESIRLKGTRHGACSCLGNVLFTPLKAALLTSHEIFIVFVSGLEERILHKMLVKRELFSCCCVRVSIFLLFHFY